MGRKREMVKERAVLGLRTRERMDKRIWEKERREL